MDELPAPDVLFRRFLDDSKTFAGARERFQLLVTDLVSVESPAASEVAAPSGSDWGIDTFVGALNKRLVVWQSKFFLDWGEPQRGQIRSSFNEVMKQAKENGFTVSAWTLCVPSILPPGEQKWFDTWSAGKRRLHKGLIIELKNGGRIRRELMRPDAAWVREQYFPRAAETVAAIAVQISELLDPLERALFVKQLNLAGHEETDAAKGYFFAAEAMARDVSARAVQAEVNALNEVELEVHGEWESAFNLARDRADVDGRIPGLVDVVMSAAAALPASSDLPLRPAHRRGIAHRLVEHVKAGWVAQWREAAKQHEGPRAGDIVTEVIQGGKS
ncbi:hypothetical protein [Microbacterium sp. Bi98]|uniref:hypothetical protein n=1 Tax=Microbacterium sp. Bi98 TaxID=2821116 RepID=UPI001E4DAA61|nr:hypothetical protein [Microbacterium sp. Bi98]